LILTGCFGAKEPPESFTSEIAKIKESWAPDKRISIFELEIDYKAGKWLIQGETSVKEAHQEVEKLVKSSFPEDVDLDFRLLPPDDFADTTTALVNVSVGNLKRNPSHQSEMVDQVLMGMELKLLKTKSYWYLVQTPSGYLGWITRGTIQRLSDKDLQKWRNADKAVFASNYGQVFQEPSEKSQVVSDLVLGSVFIKKAVQGSWAEIELSDGRLGFVRGKNISRYQLMDNRKYPDRKRIIERAKSMMGIPYMWGGHSTKSFDCSGFTSTVFGIEGYQLPRDASMQVELGDEVIPDSNYTNILPGDLIFFGPPNRITHVGICLGGSYYIHASGDVRINSLDEKDELYNSYRKRTFRHIKRIIKS
jgi:hypothetical protein